MVSDDMRYTSGGFLSLLKYTAFIAPLLKKLEQSGTGCTIAGIPTSLVGYADDMATCSNSKNKLDRALDIISVHAKRWRYQYNAKKSATMVYGERRAVNNKGAKYRNFKLRLKKLQSTITEALRTAYFITICQGQMIGLVRGF